MFPRNILPDHFLGKQKAFIYFLILTFLAAEYAPYP